MQNQQQNNKLFVCNVPFNLGTSDLQEHFGKFGAIKSFSHRLEKGIAIIEYIDSNDAKDAKDGMDDKLLLNRRIGVRYYEVKQNTRSK